MPPTTAASQCFSAPIGFWLAATAVFFLTVGCSQSPPPVEPPLDPLKELREYVRTKGRNEEPEGVNYASPSAHWVQEAGATKKRAHTHGRLLLAVWFDTHGGAKIKANTFECQANRDIHVGDRVIPQGANLAGATLGIWEPVDDVGAVWLVDQIEGSRGPHEEFIPPGLTQISVRVTNEYGETASWKSIRIITQCESPTLAIANNDLRQEATVQKLEIAHRTGTNTDWVWIADKQLQVLEVEKDSTGTILTASVQCDQNALITDREFTIGNKASGEVRARGTYFMCWPTYDHWNGPPD